MNTQKNQTIGDIADALGVSKTTVSRAISGKGRIGEETRNKILTYIEEINYKPNPMAKGLADQKTYNVGWVIPGDTIAADLPFFQRCMMGVSEVTMAENYDILISIIYDDNIAQLKRIVENKKVDGVIIGRTLVDDKAIKYLNESNLPFVVIGSTPEKKVIQIDNDHISACKEITSILLMKGIRKLALIGGSTSHVVNISRQKGFEEAIKEKGLKVDKDLMFLNNETDDDIERAVDAAIGLGAECLVCMDDRICYTALLKLHRDNIIIPDRIKIASFYNSDLLANNQPAITALKYDPKELGNFACRKLFKVIDGEDVEERSLLSYEVMLKGSTQ
ncbi:MAG: LacI family transcriptional regulator [Eubacterium sp.]|nr:LacI family transcriptional regulator [Eubacterium sp.]